MLHVGCGPGEHAQLQHRLNPPQLYNAGMRYRLATAFALVICCATGCAREPMTTEQFSSPALAPLAAAVSQGDAAEIKRQVAAGTDPDAAGADGATLLVAAIGNGNIASVQALLEAGADPDQPGGGGETPVHAAAFAQDPALLQSVLKHGGTPDVRNPVTGATPLAGAILGQHPQQLQMLLDAGADPSLADHNDDAPLHVAARTNAGATILALLEAGASPTAKNSGGASFQAYYFGFPRNVLNDRALAERREVIAWLKSHQVPVEAGADGYQ